MFVLYETPAGYAIFKLLDEKKLKEVDNLYLEFDSAESANKLLKLKHFEKFNDTAEALAAATAAVEGKLTKTLKKTLKKLVDDDVQNQLLVADAKLGSAIKEKLSIPCVANNAVQELMRCIRTQSESLLGGLPKRELTAMTLGLAHSLSRYKLKFSPDKIDTMIVQAQCLLDDLDKELNNYMMRAREWYGWHFPELGKILTDNIAFIKTIKLVGTRDNFHEHDLSDILPTDLEEKVKEAAEVSMGTEIAEEDIINIRQLCDEILSIHEYRTHLYDYLKTRMMAIAPNLTTLVGETVGARLIAHSGSLTNLAKFPASTVQILGAEKALFRALKTKKDTPKYGLIYHSTLVGQASTKNKGKISRSLAAKASLATRLDAFGEDSTFDLGTEHRARLETRLRILEEGNMKKISGTGKMKAKFEKHQTKSEIKLYPTEEDNQIPIVMSKKRKLDKPLIEEIKSEPVEQEDAEGSSSSPPKKKKKKNKTLDESELAEAEIKDEPEEEPSKKKKKKKDKSQDESIVADEVIVDEQEPVKKKKKKNKGEQLEESAVLDESAANEEVKSEKKKKKKKQAAEDE